MRAVLIAAWVGALALPLACGEAFTSPDDDGTTSSSSGGPSQTLQEACERFCAAGLGCPEVVGEDLDACISNCTNNLPTDGSCSPAATVLMDCYRNEMNGGCTLSPACMPEAAALARCQNFGCPAEALSCGANDDHDCWCTGSCGGTWVVSTPCNEDPTGDNLLCDCILTGPILPHVPMGSLAASCSGPFTADACDLDWGCCRDVLLNP